MKKNTSLIFLKITFGSIVIVFMFLALTIINNKNVIAETPVPPITLTATPEVTLDNNQISALSTELDYMKDFNNKLLTTIYASLGFVAVFLVVFLGLNWFTNNRKVEQEMKLIKEELQLDQTKKFLELQTQATAISEALTRKVDHKIVSLQYDIHIIKAENAEEKGVFANALTQYINAVNCCPDHGGIAFTLARINTIINNEKTNMHASDYSDITAAIEKIKNNEILINEIHENMKKRKK